MWGIKLMNKKVLLLGFVLLLFLPCVFAATAPTQYQAGYNLTSYIGTNNTYSPLINSTLINTTLLSNGKNVSVFNGSQWYYILSNLGIPITKSRTYSLWIYPNNTRSISISPQILVHEESATDRYFLIEYDNTNQKLKIVLVAVSGANFALNYTIPRTQFNNTWFHIVASYDASSSNTSLYINGTLVNSSNIAVASGSGGSDEFILGSDKSGTASTAFKGYMSGAYVYPYVLSSQEVSDIFTDTNNYLVYSPLNVSNNFTITAKNYYTNSTINNFSAYINGTIYLATNGTIITPYFTNYTSLINIIISSNESGGYFNRTYANYNVSTSLEAYLYYPKINSITLANNYTFNSTANLARNLSYTATIYGCTTPNYGPTAIQYVHRLINGVNDKNFSTPCSYGNNATFTDYYTHSAEGQYNISYSIPATNSFTSINTSNISIISDLYNPNPTLNYNVTYGFTTNATATYNLTCYDSMTYLIK